LFRDTLVRYTTISTETGFGKTGMPGLTVGAKGLRVSGYHRAPQMRRPRQVNDRRKLKLRHENQADSQQLSWNSKTIRVSWRFLRGVRRSDFFRTTSSPTRITAGETAIILLDYNDIPGAAGGSATGRLADGSVF
jgi:hypothetical protein